MKAIRKNYIKRAWQFILRHKIAALIIGLAWLIGIGAVTFFVIKSNNLKPIASGQLKTKKVIVPPKKFYSPLTGVEVATEAATKKQVKAIMIENSPDARPQSGLGQAGVVFEAIAEGGITRFLTLHQEDEPELIGPVRSLRPYYVDWLSAFDATVSHVGGSATALAIIRNGSYKDIDQFFNSAAYWRATDRYAPHNVYTSTAKLDELNNSKGYTSSNFTGFKRKTADTPAKDVTAAKINIDISYALFNVHYDYDKAINSYIRSEGGAQHLDREKGVIKPKTVIVIKVPTQIGMEDGYREQMTTIGSGKAYIFQDGMVTEGSWSKDLAKNQISFKDSAGAEMALNPGSTWISAIAPEKEVTWQP